MTNGTEEEQRSMDEKFMRLALNEARKALAEEEVPIGAVVVSRGAVVGRGHNLVETLSDPTAHAEMQALTAAAATVGGKYLPECTLYVTVAPCVMCAGAIVNSRGDRVGADGARGVGRRRSEEGLPPLFGIGPPSQDLRDAGDSRRGVRRADDFVFRPFARVVFEEKEKFYTFANDASDQAGRVEREKN